MAQPSIFNIGQTSVSWQITGLSSAWTTTSYQYAYIKINGQSSSPIYPPSSGTSTSTGTGSFSGLTAGTTYTAYGYAVAANGQTYAAGSATFTTASPPQPPANVTNLTASAVSKSQINLSWSAASGVTGYHIYKDDVYQNTTLTATSYAVTGLSEYTQYKLTVKAYNNSGLASGVSVYQKTKDETLPTVSINSNMATKDSITINVSGVDLHSGISGFYFYLDGVYKSVVYGVSASYTYAGLTENQSYTVGVRSFDKDLNQSVLVTQNIIAKSSRPQDFSWTYPKISGNDLYITATEWNAFTTRINEFRVYKSLTNYSFTTVYSGNDFYAYMFNQAVTAISAMNPPTSPHSTVSSGVDDVSAYGLNRLRDSLNSIT